MNGMQLSEFLKKIAAGDEIEFVFHNKTYFYQGYYENDQYVSTVDCWDEEHKSEFDGYLYEHRTTIISERLLAFEKAKIFDGKTIFDVENEIAVIFGQISF